MTGHYCPGCHTEYRRLTNPNPNEGDIVVCARCAEIAAWHTGTFINVPMTHPVRRLTAVIDAQCRAFTAGLDRALAKLIHPTGR